MVSSGVRPDSAFLSLLERCKGTDIRNWTEGMLIARDV
jgi:hypothetical protein